MTGQVPPGDDAINTLVVETGAGGQSYVTGDLGPATWIALFEPRA